MFILNVIITQIHSSMIARRSLVIITLYIFAYKYFSQPKQDVPPNFSSAKIIVRSKADTQTTRRPQHNVSYHTQASISDKSYLAIKATPDVISKSFAYLDYCYVIGEEKKYALQKA